MYSLELLSSFIKIISYCYTNSCVDVPNEYYIEMVLSLLLPPERRWEYGGEHL